MKLYGGNGKQQQGVFQTSGCLRIWYGHGIRSPRIRVGTSSKKEENQKVCIGFRYCQWRSNCTFGHVTKCVEPWIILIPSEKLFPVLWPPLPLPSAHYISGLRENVMRLEGISYCCHSFLILTLLDYCSSLFYYHVGISLPTPTW